ncbi:MAG TPA: cytochrome c [Chloroflexota bacterium]|nr:cytochrome c [Chloroflexota bacterium]
MKSVHLIGLGLVVGSLALGTMISVMTFRWQVETFPSTGPVVAAAAGPAGAAMPAHSSTDAAKAKALFDSKCSSCHSIGGGKKMGPDLKGVATRRSADWIAQFIMAPDQVIAAGDQAATQMVKEYGMPMPNLGISKEDAATLTAYISQ